MEKRLQTVNGDTILEITEDAPVKTRLSENALLRQEKYLIQTIATFESTLKEVRARLAMIITEKNALSERPE